MLPLCPCPAGSQHHPRKEIIHTELCGVLSKSCLLASHSVLRALCPVAPPPPKIKHCPCFFPIVIKYSNNSSLKENGFILASC